MKQAERTRILVLTSLFSALVFVGTRINIPLGINNRIVHVGDAAIYLAACILPLPNAMLCSAIGAALSDFTTPGCQIWVIPTLLIKPILTLFFTSKYSKFICKRNILAVILAGITGLAAYAVAEGFIYGSFITALIGIPADALQPIGSAILFIGLGYAFDKLNLKSHLERQLKGSI